MPEASSTGNDGSTPTLRETVEEFLYREAALLDAWRLDEWLALFTADGRYLVPTTDRPERDPLTDLVFIDDGMLRLRARAGRLNSLRGNTAYPWTRTPHFTTSILIKG